MSIQKMEAMDYVKECQVSDHQLETQTPFFHRKLLMLVPRFSLFRLPWIKS